MNDNDWHRCHFCGTEVCDGYERNGTRHFLSDCRPDLVQHQPGPQCTWSYRTANAVDGYNCYAYQNRRTMEWGPEHINFYEDGPT